MLFYSFEMAMAIAFLRENAVEGIQFFFIFRPCSTVLCSILLLNKALNFLGIVKK